ncbi:MAG: sulfotransferase domain-containing protein [Bauldia sp.]
MRDSSVRSLQDLAPHTAKVDAPARPSVLVVSHERSGTHFLMNAIVAAYGYPRGPFLNFDQPQLNINYFDPPAVAAVLEKVGSHATPSVIKSHHAVDFFDGVLDDVLKHVAVFYIHRDPVDVMISFWRLVAACSWHEGPRRPTALEFAAAEPEGMMMRYQQKQTRSLLHRWANHVDGWTEVAKTRGGRLKVVRYDALSSAYERTVVGFDALLGQRTGSLVPPRRELNVVTGVSADALPAPDYAAIRELALAEVGDTMRRHGYA